MPQEQLPSSFQPENLPESFKPEMNFATVNGQQIPLNDESYDIPEATRNGPVNSGIVQKLLKPIVDVSPDTRQHMAEFEQVHPVMGAFGRNALDLVLGESSPLSLGLGALGAGESVAAKMGMPVLENLLKIPSRAAGAGMAAHGLSNLGTDKSTGENIGAGVEAGLGALAMRGPRDIKLKKFTESPIPEQAQEPIQLKLPEPDPNEVPLKLSQNNNAIPEFDLPGELTRKLELKPLTEPIKVDLREPVIVKPEEAKFVYDWRQKLSNLAKNETGAVGKLSGNKARDEFWDALEAAAPAREEQEQFYSQERAKRFSATKNVKTPGFKGVYERLGKLKGELPKVDFQPLNNLHASTKNALVKQIFDSNLQQGEKIRAAVGLGKLLGESDKGAQVPQRGEIALLGKVFGPDFSYKLEQMHSGLPITKQALNEVANFTKSMMASIDLSAPLRQGLPLIHKAEFWQNLRPMIKYVANPEFYEGTMKAIQERPKFGIGEKAGLKFTSLGEDLANREEAFMSRLAEKIPGVPASERAYVGFLNKLRADTFDNLIDYAQKTGQLNDQTTKDIARFVNNATGRGSLGRFEKNALELNYALFSPRLLSSRLTMLNPAYYAKLSPIARKEALKSLLSVASAGGLVSSLGAMSGGTVNTDPTNSDFMKVKIGNTRLDPYGGFQQYIVAASKILAQKRTSSNSGKSTTFGSNPMAPTTLSTVMDFGRSKLSPIASFATDMMAGKDSAGKSFSTDKALAQRVIPMYAQDMYDLVTTDPDVSHMLLAIPAGLGMGIQTYDQPTTKKGLKPIKAISGGLQPIR